MMKEIISIKIFQANQKDTRKILNSIKIPMKKLKLIRTMKIFMVNLNKMIKYLGLPISQSVPKSEEDLIEKFSYIQTVDDLIDIYFISQDYFGVQSITKFLERFNVVKNKEQRNLIYKSKEQNFIFKKEIEIKSEMESKTDIFFDKIFTSLKDKSHIYNNKDYMNIIFEFVYRFKKVPIEDILKHLEQLIVNKELKNNSITFFKTDLLKLSFLMSQHQDVNISENAAKETLDFIAEKFIELGLENLNFGEIYNVVMNFTKNKFNPHVELLTLLEPYIIRELLNIKYFHLVTIFSAYLRNYRGTDFFIKTLGFHLSSRIKDAHLEDIRILFSLSHNKYFKNDHLTCRFTDFFNKKNLIDLSLNMINDLKKHHLFSIISGIINMGCTEKKYFQVISTIFLRYVEKMTFEELIKLSFFFSLADYENEILQKKIIDVLKLQMICIKNQLDGNENMKNMIGVLDTNLIDRLEKEYFPHTIQITRKIKDFHTIQNNSFEINNVLNTLSKFIWICAFTSIKHFNSFNPNSLIELIKDSIHLFNRFVAEIKENVYENTEIMIDEEICISKENIDILLLSFVYFNNETNFKYEKNTKEEEKYFKKEEEKISDKSKHKKLNLNINSGNNNNQIKSSNNKTTLSTILGMNFNIEFLQQIKIIDHDIINFKNYKKFIVFSMLIEHYIKSKDKLNENLKKEKIVKKFHLALDEKEVENNNYYKYKDSQVSDKIVENVEKFNFFKDTYYGIRIMNKDYVCYMDPTFSNKTIINNELKEQIIFINQPYEHMKISDSVSGKIKFRREICKRLKIDFIDYDYYEFLNFFNINEDEFEVTPDNFDQYQEKINEYINVKNEIYIK